MRIVPCNITFKNSILSDILLFVKKYGLNQSYFVKSSQLFVTDPDYDYFHGNTSQSFGWGRLENESVGVCNTFLKFLLDTSDRNM